MNPKSILFLYEGETEEDFYKKLIGLKLPERRIRRNYGNLHGVYNITEKVQTKINAYLANPDYNDRQQIHVFVAFDREGERHEPSLLRLEELRREFIFDGSRVKGIHELIATQDLEAWFFHDLAGIYAYLRVPTGQRNMAAYPNPDRLNNRELSQLFRRYKKLYQKGKRAAGFIDALDLELIFNHVPELQSIFGTMNGLL